MRPARIAVLVLGVLGAAVGAWALHYSGALSTAVALRLGAGLGVGVVLLVIVPYLWPRWLDDARFEKAVRGQEMSTGEQPRSLGQIELIVQLATSRRGGAYDVHYRLRPILRDLARHHLYQRRLVDLDANPEQARAILGDALWELVDEGCPEPEERQGPGISVANLADIVQRLESL